MAKQKYVQRLVSIYQERARTKDLIFQVECQKDAANYLIEKISNRASETMLVLMLNSQHEVIAEFEPFHGTINTAPACPREIFQGALLCNAQSIIIAHNHPSGSLNPSEADRQSTEKIRQAGETLSIEVLDSFVIGDGDWTSILH